MVKIKKLKNESISKLRAAIKSDDFETVFKPKFLDGKDNGFSSDDLELLEGHYEVPEITLKIDKKGKYDFENAKLIYETFRFLTPEQADDGRLWVYLANCHFYEYTKERWLSSTSSQNLFSRRILYEGTGRGVRTRNSISRLWWTAYLTYEPHNLGKEWDLTKAIFELQDLQVGLLERNMGSYPKVLKTFLAFYLEKKSEMKSTIVQEMVKELNNIGGVFCLSFLEEDQINEILKTLFEKYKVEKSN
jgi:hypothetical protein